MQQSSRTQLTVEDLLSKASFDGPLENHWFLSITNSEKTADELSIRISSAQTEMRGNYPLTGITGQRIDLFPQVDIQLVSYGDDLIPIERDLIRDPGGNCYWDITLSPGKVWTEPSDQGWNRAALPFQLSNIYENDSHHGIATFLYREGEISPLFYQIVAETKAFMCPANFQAWGYLDAAIGITKMADTKTAIDAFNRELNDQYPLEDLYQWRTPSTEKQFAILETGFGSDTTLINGLVIDGTIYSSPGFTQYGDYPYPRGLKFGIWSATKTAFCSIACLRLAQKFGADPRTVKIADLLPEAKENVKWQDITIGHCLNMATGIGTAAPDPQPLDIFADYILDAESAKVSAIAQKSYDHYFDWFLAPSQHEKNVAAFACPSFPWRPDTVARYRDQDLYIAGAALDAWLKQEAGNHARIWDLLIDEVYRPAGVHHPVQFHTIETDLSKEVPLSDAGMLLTLDNIAALGKLIHSGGKIANQQILHPKILAEWFDPAMQKGLPTGTHTDDGEVYYYGGIWHMPYASSSGKTWWLPTMRGYGGQQIQILPNGTTAFRFGFDSYETELRYDAIKLARLSDTIRPF